MVISNAEINYPYVRQADVLIALSQVALDTYLADLKKGGLLIVDPDAVRTGRDVKDARVVPVPAAAIAHETGGLKYQNIVALGALQFLIADFIEAAPVKEAIEFTVPRKTLNANLKAFERGQTYVKDYLNSKHE